jgi:hypothetical protein
MIKPGVEITVHLKHPVSDIQLQLDIVSGWKLLLFINLDLFVKSSVKLGGLNVQGF